MIQMCYRYTSDRDKAMQIVNDGFLKVFKNIDRFEAKGSLEGWIRRIVYRSISDFFRSEKKYLRLMVFEEKEKVAESSVLNNFYYEDLIQMINHLPSTSAKVFRLYAVEGYKHREIAKLLNISEGTSKWNLSEARKHMKAMIKMRNKKLNYAG